MKALIDRFKRWLCREEFERHEMQLVAIMTASLGNTEYTRKERIANDHPYWSQAYADTCSAVDREMAHRSARELQEIEVLELRGKRNVLQQQFADAITQRDEFKRRLALCEKDLVRLTAEVSKPFESIETDSAPPFDADDSTRLREFLATPTGKRLRANVNWWSQCEEHMATRRTDKFENACGQARGFRRCAEFILNKLSADTRLQQGEDTQNQHGAAGLRERVAP